MVQNISASATTESSSTSNPPGSALDFHDLVVEFSDPVYRLAYSIVKDRSTAEDVTQDTLVKAWVALPSFRRESSLKSWVMKIAYHNAISSIRERKTIVLDPNDIPERGFSDDQSIENKALMQEFIEALDQLDDLSRSIVVLREIEGLSYEEIVGILKVPMPTVKTRLFRARRRLSVILQEWK